jgi:two-component system response regulator AtoC
VPTSDARIATNTTIDGDLGPRGGRVQLVALGADESLITCELPGDGSVTIGRGEGADLELPDLRVSRQHARVHVGPGPSFAVEDLGSVNGTRIGRERLPPGQRVSIRVGEAIFIGSTIALVQSTAAALRPARLLPRERSEVQLAEACASLVRTARPFALVLVEVLDGFQCERTSETAARLLPADAVFARDGVPYAVLVADGSPAFEEAMAGLGPAIATGRADFPRDAPTVEGLLAKARGALEAACMAVPVGEQVVFSDHRMRRLYELARRAAVGLVSVLVLGETGVGKDVMARAIHAASPRRAQPFQRVDCAALTEALAESELFGHERGAFTGALTAKPGLIESAEGGTVFLDEVGELPPRLQAKLLHVLESKQSTRVGAIKGRGVDVRFIAATNRDLEDDVARGLFRKDLYYRINGFLLSIPPLRERPGEILPLARAMLREACRQLGRDRVPAFAAASVQLLEGHDWPGNVRELRNVIERSLLLCDGDRIVPEHLPFEDDLADTLESPAAVDASEMPNEQRRRIVEALAACGGNQVRAAKMLGIARSTLVVRLDAFGITRPRKKAQA